MQFTTLLTTVSLLATTIAAPVTSPVSLSLAFSFPSPQLNNWFQSSSSPPQQPASALPASPPAGMSLKWVALGLGTQNYTCASPSATPTAIGALANLYDATRAVSDSRYGQEAIQQGTCYADKYNSAGPLQQMGQHFFNAAGQPTFNLWSVGALLQAKKTADVPAPSNACTGRNGAGAVDWLQLMDNGAGVSYGGVSAVYRIETAGGKAPATCNGMPGAFTSDYAALYWFYG